MNGFLIYIIKSSILLTVFDAFFLWVMRRSEWFRFNRIVLLAGSAVCLLLPLIPVRVKVPTAYSLWLGSMVAEPIGTSSVAVTTAAGVSTGVDAVQWTTIILAFYVIGAIVALIFYIRSYSAMFRLMKHYPGKHYEGFTLHLIDDSIPSFSWLRHIFIWRNDFERYPAIFTHEQAHVRCGHSIDLLLSSALTVFQWFNPLVWICRSELKQVHEYEADNFVLDKGIDATQYQLLLVKKAVGEKRFLLANGFNHSKLKNRIMMMQTTHRAAWKKLSLLLLIPLLAATTLLMAECSSNDAFVYEEQNSIDKVVSGTESLSDNSLTKATTSEVSEPVKYGLMETKPRFQDGDANSFSLWVNQHLHYPKEAWEKKIQGRVTLQFVIEEDGSLTNIKVLRGPDPILNNEAVKVVSQSPKWTPGYINGKPVRVVFNYPVVFQIP